MHKEQLTAHLEYSDKQFIKRDVFKEGGSKAFVLNFQPGQELPVHTHPESSVHLLVLKGKGTFTINNEEIPATENDILLLNENDEISFINDSTENASVYITLNKTAGNRKKPITYNIIDYNTFSS